MKSQQQPATSKAAAAARSNSTSCSHATSAAAIPTNPYQRVQKKREEGRGIRTGNFCWGGGKGTPPPPKSSRVKRS